MTISANTNLTDQELNEAVARVVFPERTNWRTFHLDGTIKTFSEMVIDDKYDDIRWDFSWENAKLLAEHLKMTIRFDYGFACCHHSTGENIVSKIKDMPEGYQDMTRAVFEVFLKKDELQYNDEIKV